MGNFRPIKIIIGLGNPGPRYEATRHNAGFMAIDELSFRCGSGKWEKGAASLFQKCGFGRASAVLAKPQTYMNRSGAAAAALIGLFGLCPVDIIVLHDDLDLPLGGVKLKAKGGDAGHKGVGSIIGALGTGEFARIRIGIGRPPEGADATEYVLGPFTGEEAEVMGASIAKAADKVEEIFRRPEKDQEILI